MLETFLPRYGLATAPPSFVLLFSRISCEVTSLNQNQLNYRPLPRPPLPFPTPPPCRRGMRCMHAWKQQHQLHCNRTQSHPLPPHPHSPLPPSPLPLPATSVMQARDAFYACARDAFYACVEAAAPAAEAEAAAPAAAPREQPAGEAAAGAGNSSLANSTLPPSSTSPSSPASPSSRRSQSKALEYPPCCQSARSLYEKSCRPAWVLHFDRLYVAERNMKSIVGSSRVHMSGAL
ncbi:unnamed protein product [Closterium sp. NIES-54]